MNDQATALEKLENSFLKFPQTFSWPHLNSDVGLEEEEY